MDYIEDVKNFVNPTDDVIMEDVDSIAAKMNIIKNASSCGDKPTHDVPYTDEQMQDAYLTLYPSYRAYIENKKKKILIVYEKLYV